MIYLCAAENNLNKIRLKHGERSTHTEVVPCERHHALQRGDADVQAQHRERVA
jgi:hypothetical protein